MPSQRYTPETIARAEKLVSRIQGISSCRISTDGNGRVTEVHVVATARKAPKLVARDVESCLEAELGMTVDYKKIGVVVVDAETPDSERGEGAAKAPATRQDVVHFPLEEFSSRFAFQSVNVFMTQETVHAEVELIRNGAETFGAARASNAPGAHMRVVAEATLKAVSELLDDGITLCLSDLTEIQLGGDTAMVVKVNMLHKRTGKDFVGCSLFSGNSNQTVVFATLDAVNRVVGVLKTKDSVEYNIE